MIPRHINKFFIASLLALFLIGWQGISVVHAGAQMYQPLSASVRSALRHSVSDQGTIKSAFTLQVQEAQWVQGMSQRFGIEKRIPDANMREDFLKMVHYEATRAGLDPRLVLGLIKVESGFKKYAVSRAGARGFMQVMPFWVGLIGTPTDNLFHPNINVRYGCTILRHYLDMEKGDLYRALGRYNGSLGKPEYPNLVNAAWQKN